MTCLVSCSVVFEGADHDARVAVWHQFAAGRHVRPGALRLPHLWPPLPTQFTPATRRSLRLKHFPNGRRHEHQPSVAGVDTQNTVYKKLHAYFFCIHNVLCTGRFRCGAIFCIHQQNLVLTRFLHCFRFK